MIGSSISFEATPSDATASLQQIRYIPSSDQSSMHHSENQLSISVYDSVFNFVSAKYRILVEAVNSPPTFGCPAQLTVGGGTNNAPVTGISVNDNQASAGERERSEPATPCGFPPPLKNNQNSTKLLLFFARSGFADSQITVTVLAKLGSVAIDSFTVNSNGVVQKPTSSNKVLQFSGNSLSLTRLLSTLTYTPPVNYDGVGDSILLIVDDNTHKTSKKLPVMVTPTGERTDGFNPGEGEDSN